MTGGRSTGRDTLLLVVPRLGLSLRLSRRSITLTVTAAAAAAITAAVSITIGEYPLTVAGVLRVLRGGGTLIEQDVVLGDRLPRAVTGLGVGAAFALSGAILQRLAGNPLVSPDVVGINSGAATGALTVMLILGGSGAELTVGALIGAALTVLAIVLIAYRRGLLGFRLVLVGIGVAALLSSAISYLLTRSDVHQVQAAAGWLTGSLANRSGTHATIIGVTLTLAALALTVLGRDLRVQELGDDLARTLTGTRHARRIPLLLVAVGLAAMATAAAGPIGFVALVAPQITRRVLAERQIGLAPSAAVGALLVAGADLASRLIFAPDEMPVGVLTAVLGAPVLLVLLARAHRIGAAG
ncbi:iron chelate uptake ABC transporter family permease subunit [Parafrankia sp. FMc6]|uniref:FecCD family ABC transporter permease n=1 Tax=Parafrankia soli TaxID=2599596 RepID=UPI0034D6DC20